MESWKNLEKRYLENKMSLILSFIFGIIFAYIYEKLPFYKFIGKKSLIIFGYKLHHSLYGLFLIIVGVLDVFQINNLLLVSAGIGMIFEHYLTGGKLDFITKEK